MFRTYLFILLACLVCPLKAISGDKLQLIDKLRYENNLEGSIQSISSLPDGKHLAAAYNVRSGASAWVSKRSGQNGLIKGTVIIWDLQTRKYIKELPFDGVIHFVKCSANGKFLVVGYYKEQSGHNIRVLKIPDYNTICDFEIKQKDKSKYFNHSALAITPDSKNILAGISMVPQGEIIIYDITNGKYINTLKGGKSSVYTITFNSNGNLMVSVSEDKIQVWDVNGFVERNNFSVQRGESALISPDGGKIAVSTIGSRNYGGKIALTLNDSRSGRQLFDLKCLLSGSHLEFTPDSKFLIQGVGGFLVLYDTENGEKIYLADCPQIQSIAMIPNSNILATGNQTGSIWLWKIGSD